MHVILSLCDSFSSYISPTDTALKERRIMPLKEKGEIMFLLKSKEKE